MLAARGSCRFGSGEQKIEETETQTQLRRQARKIQIQALLAALVLTGLCLVSLA